MFSWSTGRYNAREELLLRNTLPVFLLQDAPVVFSTQVQGVEGVPLRGTGHLAFAVLDSAVLTQPLVESSDSSELKGSLQDEVRPAGAPLQRPCLCGALPFGTVSQAWQLACAPRLPPCSTASALLCVSQGWQPHPSSQGQQLPEEEGNQDRTLVDVPLPASLVYTFQICTWLYVRARWHHSDPQHSPACLSQDEAFLSSQLLTLSMTFFYVHTTDLTKVIQTVLIWKNTNGMKSPTIIQVCFRCWGQTKVFLYYCSWFKANREIHISGTGVRHQIYFIWFPAMLTLHWEAQLCAEADNFCSDGSYV